MSGFAEDVFGASGLREGGEPLLDKPFTVRQLLERCAEILSDPRA
jgi:hypothetical protein